MEITKNIQNNIIEIMVEGRLDAYWSEHLSRELSEILRTGADKIYLNMSKINYISSAGVRILIQYSKKIKELNGEFSITEPSEPVKSVLEMTGLDSIIFNPGNPEKKF
nr:STAS domain-containing protein [Candidatus Dependentiae bacterium]